jgi:hypothetical protein
LSENTGAIVNYSASIFVIHDYFIDSDSTVGVDTTYRTEYFGRSTYTPKGGCEMDVTERKNRVVMGAWALIKEIETLASQQKDLWPLVPWYALRAYVWTCRKGDKRYEIAFRKGIWSIEDSWDSDYYKVAIDCATGALCTSLASEDIVFTRYLLRCAFADDLDANWVINHLRKEVDILGPSEVNERRFQILAKKFGITGVFDRAIADLACEERRRARECGRATE